MAQMDIEQLSPDLPLKPLYVIHGEEDLLRVEALDVLRQAARQQGYLNREVYSADSASFDWQELLHAAGSMGLFADLKLLEIHIPGGKPGKAGGDALQELAGRLPEDTAVVLMLPKLERAQMQAKWFAALAKHGVVLEAKAVSGAALPQWIQGRLKQAGLEIEADALSLFAERVEGNLLAAKQEIDKLALLHPRGHIQQMADAEAAVAALADGSRTRLILVARPQPATLREVARTQGELAALGLQQQYLVLNGVLPQQAVGDDPLARALWQREQAALAAMPMRSTSSSLSRSPAVSMMCRGTPSIWIVCCTLSRVVPAMGVTMASSAPAKALSNELLPALGCPAITTLMPSRSSAPWRARCITCDSVCFKFDSCPRASALRRKSISSSGKSSVASTSMRR